MFSKKLKKLIAIVIIVSMVFSNAGFTTFADSVETHTTISVSNGNVNDYHNEENETTKESTSEKINEENESTTVEESEDEETTTVEEPEEDETTTTVAESEEDETTTTVVESEENETTTTVVESEENETTTTVVESEKDETTITVVASEETATDSDADYDAVVKEEMNGDDTATQSETLINLELEQPELSPGLFGASDYILNGYFKNLIPYGVNIINITITRTLPSSSLYTLLGTIDGSNSLACYITNDIYASASNKKMVIYAANPSKTIRLTQNAEGVFDNLEHLESINGLELVDTSNVTSMKRMFRDCFRMRSVDVSSFDTSSVTNMESMFEDCAALESIDTSNFDTSSVTNMAFMFDGCESIQSLDLSNFDTRNVTYIIHMFKDCFDLKTIEVGSNFKLSSIVGSTSMFTLCNNLVGGNGTRFNGDHIDSEYARIDGGTPSPGYFTSSGDFTLPNTWFNQMTGKFRTEIETITIEKSAPVTTGEELYYIDDSDGLQVERNGTDIKIHAPRDKNIYLAQDSSDLFYDFGNLKTLYGLQLVDTSKVTNMRRMFGLCYDLTSIDVSSFDTSNVTEMSRMFYGCNSLTSIDVSSFDTSNVTEMSRMFYGCNNLTSIDVSSFDTSIVTDMSSMFEGCRNLTSIDISNFKDDLVTSTEKMFSQCTAIQTININPNNFRAITETNMYQMFYGCANLTTVDVSGFCGTNVINMSGMFSSCQALTTINLPNFVAASSSDASQMFFGCRALTTIDISSLNTRCQENMFKMFAGCSNLTRLDVSGWDTSRVKNLSGMFSDCSNITTIYSDRDFSRASILDDADMFTGCISLVGGNGTRFNEDHIDSEYARIDDRISNPGYFTYRDGGYTLPNTWFDQMIGMSKSDITSIRIEYSAVASTGDELYYINDSNGLQVERNGSNIKIHAPRINNINLPQDSSEIFANFENLTTIVGLGLASTSNVTNMSGMFSGCQQLTWFDISNFDTRNVTDFSSMFEGCDRLVGTLDLSMFNTRSARDLSHMFEKCRRLTGINVSSFDTSVVTDMSAMFKECGSITSIDISNFKDDLVTSTEDMFYNCTAIQTININPNNFRAITETNMHQMFYGCNNLTTVDVSGFCGTNVINTSRLFGSCQALTTINLPNFVAASSSDAYEMFYDCRALTTLNISRLDTQSLENMFRMFAGCQSLSSIDVSHFNTSKVRNFAHMFERSVITSIDLSHFDTSQAVFANSMFYNCPNLINVNLSGWDAPEDIRWMFEGCPNLTSVNVSGWDTSRVTMANEMFFNCPMLTTIYADKDFSQASITYHANMFRGCVNLVGGDGTIYDDKYTDAKYAKIDGSYDKPGYFTVAPWTVTLNANGGTFANGSSTKSVNVYEGTSTSRFEKPSKEGYVFDKYYNGTTPINDTWTYGGAVSQVKAGYIPNNYTVRYNANGGKGTMGVDIATYGEIYKIKAPTYKNEGYSFTGWTYGGNTYNANTEVSNLTSEKDGEVIFKANWGPKSTTINYHANGGVGTMSSKDFVYGNDATLDPCTFTKDGYTFNGWALSPNADAILGDEAIIFAEEAYREVIDVYATWIYTQAIYGTLELDGNGGYINGVAVYKRYYEKDEQITDVTKYRKGYDFENWLDNTSAVVAYPTICDFNNTLTLTADWSQLTNKVRYHANNGTGAYFDDDVLASVTNYSAKPLVDLGWTKANYTFSGWAFRSDDTIAVYGDAGNIGSINKTKLDLYAVWTGVPYTITLHNFDPTAAGTSRDKIDSFTYGKNKKISEVVNKEYSVGTTKYLFSGWTSAVSRNQVMYYDTHNADIVYEIEAGTSGINIDLYAIWIKKTDAVYMTFDGNGGTINGEGKLTVTLAPNSNIPYPSGRIMYKKGEVHNGWLDTNKVTPYNQVTVNFTGSKTIYASWTTVGATYTLKYTAFDIDTTSPVMADETKDCDATFNLTENSYTRFGYGFIGWDTKEDADVVVYTDKQSVSKLGDAGETVTLWAVWSDKDYVLRYYDYNSVMVNKATLSFTERKTIIFNSNIPIGKKDAGFKYTDLHGNVKRFNSGQVVSIKDFEINETTTNIDLFGEIKDKIYHITFNANGGVFKDNKNVKLATISYMQKIEFPEIGSRDSYIANGWGLTGTQYYSYDEDKEFRVKWIFDVSAFISSSKNNGSSSGSGGSKGGGGIFKQLDRAINFVVQTPIAENEYSFMLDTNGRKVGIKLSANSNVAKALIQSSETKGSYQLLSDGYIQLKGGGLFKLNYMGQDCYFAVDNLGNMMTGFVVTSDRTVYLTVGANYSFKKAFEEKGEKYYLYEEDGQYRGMLWNQPIVIAQTLYTFDSQGKVVSTVDTTAKQGVWEYSPVDNKWKFFVSDNNGQVTYYKDGVYDIFYNNQVLKFGFDENGNMLTGLYTLNGVTYFAQDSGVAAGAIINI